MIDLGPSKRSRQPLQVDRNALRGHARPIKKRRNKKRLKKLEGGFDLRNVKDTTGTIEGDRNDTRILGKYDALTDDYCVFARGDTFRRHFTEMVGSNSLELLQQSRPRMDKPLSRLIKTPDVSSLPAFEVPIADMVPSLLTAKRSSRPYEAVVDDPMVSTDETPLFKAWGEASLRTQPEAPERSDDRDDPLLNPPPIRYLDEPSQQLADPALGSPRLLVTEQGTQSILAKMNKQPPQIAIRVRGATGPLGYVEYDPQDTLRDLRKTLIDAQMVPSRDHPPRFAFVLPDGTPVPFKQEHLERVRGFGAHVYIHVMQNKRDHNVSPLGEAETRKLLESGQMRSKNRGVDQSTYNEYGMKPTPSVSSEYDYLPVVSYAEAADKARLGPLLAKIREIAGAAALQIQKRVRILLAKICVDLMLHDPALAAERARLRASKQKVIDDKKADEARKRQAEADKRRKEIEAQQSKEKLQQQAKAQADTERKRIKKTRREAHAKSKSAQDVQASSDAGDAEAASIKCLDRTRDGPALYRGAVQDAYGTHLLLAIIAHPEGLVLEAYTALTDDRVEGSVVQKSLEAVIDGWKGMDLKQKAAVCTSLSACTRVVGTAAPKLTADLDKMPFSKQEWYDLEIPISSQTSLVETVKSVQDLFSESITRKDAADPLLLCVSKQPSPIGEVSAFEQGDALCFVSQAGSELLVQSAMWAATGYGPLSFLLRMEKEALAAVLSSDLELKGGKLAIKIRASPRPDMAALMIPKTAAAPKVKLLPYEGQAGTGAWEASPRPPDVCEQPKKSTEPRETAPELGELPPAHPDGWWE